MRTVKSQVGIQPPASREIFVEIAMLAFMRIAQLIHSKEITDRQNHLRFELARVLQLERPQIYLGDAEWFTLLELVWTVVESESHVLFVPEDVKLYLTYLQGIRSALSPAVFEALYSH